jgi:aminopeptidase-like protein
MSATRNIRISVHEELRYVNTLADIGSRLNLAALGRECHDLIVELYPICRSITGNGFRETLARLRRHIPLTVHEVPTGSEAFDWTVPKEWNIRDAYVRNSRGERVIDFQNSNLHVVNYSIPVSGRMSLEELKKHLFSSPEHPDWIPYRTSYYRDTWGFCVSHRKLEQLNEEEYEVCIDSTLEDGSLTYGEFLACGATEDEVLVSCHACHPSLCNDNLSGVALAVFVAKFLISSQPRYSYRFLFIPGTIGSIAWLSRNERIVHRIKHGLVLSCVGDRGPLSYKRSRRGDAEIDRAAHQVLKDSGQRYKVTDFSPYGNDERQYCSPGFNLPVGRLSRTPDGEFAEYHTSADNLSFVDAASLGDSLGKCLAIFEILEENRVYVNQNPKCEPQLGKRGLYRTFGGYGDSGTRELAMLWVLSQSDGTKSLLDIAERSGLSFASIHRAADTLQAHGLLREREPESERQRVGMVRETIPARIRNERNETDGGARD